jgi:hypothetical protein
VSDRPLKLVIEIPREHAVEHAQRQQVVLLKRFVAAYGVGVVWLRKRMPDPEVALIWQLFGASVENDTLEIGTPKAVHAQAKVLADVVPTDTIRAALEHAEALGLLDRDGDGYRFRKSRRRTSLLARLLGLLGRLLRR